MYFEINREDEANLILEESLNRYNAWLESEGENWNNTLMLSQIYALQNEEDKSLEYFSKTVDYGVMWGWEYMIENSPFWGNMVKDPEFKRLVQRAKDKSAARREQIREMEEKEVINL